MNELQLSFLPKEISGAEFRIEIEAIHKEYGNLIEKIDSIKSLEELAPLKKEADLILEKLSVLISKISDDKISHKEELTTLKAELGDIISKKEHLVAEYNNLIIELNAKRERENVLKESLEKITQEEENIGLEIKEAKAKPADNKEILAKLDKENEGLEKK